jgi:hypothetical protein
MDKETLYHRNKILNKPLEITFFKDSKSEVLYGNMILVDLIIDNEEAETLFEGYYLNQRNMGLLKAREVIITENSKNNYKLLCKIGFDSNDIYEVRHT